MSKGSGNSLEEISPILYRSLCARSVPKNHTERKQLTQTWIMEERRSALLKIGTQIEEEKDAIKRVICHHQFSISKAKDCHLLQFFCEECWSNKMECEAKLSTLQKTYVVESGIMMPDNPNLFPSYGHPPNISEVEYRTIFYEEPDMYLLNEIPWHKQEAMCVVGWTTCNRCYEYVKRCVAKQEFVEGPLAQFVGVTWRSHWCADMSRLKNDLSPLKKLDSYAMPTLREKGIHCKRCKLEVIERLIAAYVSNFHPDDYPRLILKCNYMAEAYGQISCLGGNDLCLYSMSPHKIGTQPQLASFVCGFCMIFIDALLCSTPISPHRHRQDNFLPICPVDSRYVTVAACNMTRARRLRFKKLGLLWTV